MKKIKNIRNLIQILLLITVIIAASNHLLISNGVNIPWISESIFHYICPVCGVTSIYQFFASSTMLVTKLKSTLGIVIGLAIISTIIFGPIICGFICPFGAIQDLTAKLGKKLFKYKYNTFINSKVDKKLKYLRYIMLVLTVILTASSGVMILEKINPYHAFLGMFKGSISLVGFIILILILLVSLFIQRPWCRYICPYGAFLGLFNKFKVFRIVRNDNSCINCKKCNKNCPMGIDITSKEEVRDLSCISCLECVKENVCPKDETISYTSDDIEIENYKEQYNLDVTEGSCMEVIVENKEKNEIIESEEK